MTMQLKEHWETIYQRHDSAEANWYQDYPQLSLQFIESAGLTAEQTIIDVGGGTSLLVDNLLLRGFEKTSVLDISESAIEQSRCRLGLKADQVEWHVADVRNFVSPHRYDLWHDRAVFHFLVDETDRRAYKDVLRTTLKPEGQLILSAFSLDGPESCSGLPVRRYDTDMLEEEMGVDFSLIESWPEEHITPSGGVQPFIYSLFTRRNGTL